MNFWMGVFVPAVVVSEIQEQKQEPGKVHDAVTFGRGAGKPAHPSALRFHPLIYPDNQ